MRRSGGIPYAEKAPEPEALWPPFGQGDAITEPNSLAAAAASAHRAILADPTVAAQAAETYRDAATWHSTEATRFPTGSSTHTHHKAVATRFLRDAAEYEQAANQP